MTDRFGEKRWIFERVVLCGGGKVGCGENLRRPVGVRVPSRRVDLKSHLSEMQSGLWMRGG